MGSNPTSSASQSGNFSLFPSGAEKWLKWAEYHGVSSAGINAVAETTTSSWLRSFQLFNIRDDLLSVPKRTE